MLKWKCMSIFLLVFSALNFSSHADDPNPPVKDFGMRGTGKEEIAMLDRHDLYRRYENKNDWDYRQNWQVDPQAYLRGEQVFEGPQRDYIYPNGTTQYPYSRKNNFYYYDNSTNPYNDTYYYRTNWNNSYPSSASYDTGVYYTKPLREDNSSNNTDYRENWQNDPHSFLRGQYNQEHPYSGYNHYPTGYVNSSYYDTGVYYTKPRREDNSSNNTDYRENWQNDPQDYLRGAYNQEHPYSGYNYYPTGYANYDRGVYYTKPKREDNSSNNTDYRQNWQNNPGSYLRGNSNQEHPKSGYGIVYPPYNKLRYAPIQYTNNVIQKDNRGAVVQPPLKAESNLAQKNNTNQNTQQNQKNESRQPQVTTNKQNTNQDDPNKIIAENEKATNAKNQIKLYSHKSWDYRQNWRTHRKIYLKGEYQKKFENRLIAETRKKAANKANTNQSQNSK